MNLLKDAIFRKNCVLCNYTIENGEIITIPNIPISIKNTSTDINCFSHDFNVTECKNCGISQLTHMIPLKILYDENPPMTQGKIFKEMFESFSDFIKDNCGDSSKFLEIGDPSCKTLNSCIKKGIDIKKWIIMDPNLETVDTIPEFCERIKDWFDPYKDFEIKVDCIITSHVFEHFYEPNLVLQKFSKISEKLIFSLPNMSIMAESKRLPPIGMLFQHTFYIDENILNTMFRLNGWNIEKFEYFKDNSIFIYASKIIKPINIELKKNNSFNLLNQVINRVENFIIYLKNYDFKSNDNIYVFGSHFGTQVLVSKGLLESCKIKGILDNDKRKSEKKLYGTGLTVYDPRSVMEKFKKIFIIFFPYQSYENEIRDGIMELSQELNTEVKYLYPDL
jgi:hypothetical protein